MVQLYVLFLEVVQFLDEQDKFLNLDRRISFSSLREFISRLMRLMILCKSDEILSASSKASGYLHGALFLEDFFCSL